MCCSFFCMNVLRFRTTDWFSMHFFSPCFKSKWNCTIIITLDNLNILQRKMIWRRIKYLTILYIFRLEFSPLLVTVAVASAFLLSSHISTPTSQSHLPSTSLAAISFLNSYIWSTNLPRFPATIPEMKVEINM